MFKKTSYKYCDENILNENSTSDPLNPEAAEFLNNNFVKI